MSYVAKLRKWSNYSALHRFDVKTINNVEIRRKTFKTTQNYESDQIIVHCIDFTSKQSKMLRYVANIQNNANQRKSSNYNAWHRFDVLTIKTFELRRKTTKVIKLYCIASIRRLNDQNFWVTSLNYKSNKITMDCIDLTSKQSKMLRYVAKHSKQRKPTKVIKL